jgi:hypothetical protein
MEPLNPTKAPPQPSVDIDHGHHALPLRTLSSDLAEAVRVQQGSAIKIAIAEDERRAAERDAASPTSKSNLSFILASIVIVLVAGGGVGFALWYKAQSTAAIPVSTTPVVTSIVRTEATDTLDITGKTNTEIARSFRAIVANPGIRIGTMKNVLITTTPAGGTATRVPANQFLSALGAHTTPAFLRALSQDYMLGMYFYDRTNGYIILSGTARDYLLSGMIAWEPYMVQDLAPILGIDTTGDKAALLNAPFADTLIENRTTRAVVGTDNKPVFFYSFLDDGTIFIGADGKTLTEAIRRLHQ